MAVSTPTRNRISPKNTGKSGHSTGTRRKKRRSRRSQPFADRRRPTMTWRTSPASSQCGGLYRPAFSMRYGQRSGNTCKLESSRTRTATRRRTACGASGRPRQATIGVRGGAFFSARTRPRRIAIPAQNRNASAAYIRAGYSASGASHNSTRLMGNDGIRAVIAALSVPVLANFGRKLSAERLPRMPRLTAYNDGIAIAR